MISRQSLIVAKWEFLRFFKWKQQLISYLIMLGSMLAVSLWGYFNDEGRQQYRIAVPSNYGIENTAQFQFQRPSISFDAQLQQMQNDTSWHAVLTEQDGKLTIHTLSGKKWLQQLETELQRYSRQQSAKRLGLSGEQLMMLEQPVDISTQFLDQSYKGKDTPEKIIAMGVLILLLVGLSAAFGQVLISVTSEKQQRVTEQLIAIVTPQQWMDGKVLGHSLSAMKAMVTSAIVMLLGLTVISIFSDKSQNLSWLSLNVILWLIPFALAGVLLCANFMGAIAASIDDPNSSGKSAVMMITWLPMVLTFLVIDSPSGMGMTILSWLPVTSFAAMPVRMAMVEVPWWQALLSLTLLIAAVFWMRRVAGRVFLRGMQMFGKEPTWGDIMRWAMSNKAD